jgi:hypothetical protein
MIQTLVVILILATFLLGCVAILEDLDRQIEKAMLEELWDDGDDPEWVVEARHEIAGLPETAA